MTFDELGLNPSIIKAIKEKGYKQASPIQSQAIPLILRGKDILGGAQTGTGKTAAFALPLLQKLDESEPCEKTKPKALILAPTRELADQVAKSFKEYGKYTNFKYATLVGGVKIGPQISSLEKAPHIVIATPGRLKDHLKQKSISLASLKFLVLDEADRMLDMGFRADIYDLVKEIPKSCQNLLFSATYNDEVAHLGKKLLNNPSFVEVALRNAAADKVKQIIHYVDKGERFNLLAYLIKEGQWYQALVFVKTKHSADRVASQLLKEGIPADSIHGDKRQGARTRALKNFKSGDLQILVATDVAARGIDLHDLDYVVNFELPQIPEDYVHRIGRTGRAGKSGTALSLISYSEKNQLIKIEKIIKKKIPVELIKGFEPKYDINFDRKKKDTPQKSTKSKREPKKGAKSSFSRSPKTSKKRR